jgi:hypothetical protein
MSIPLGARPKIDATRPTVQQLEPSEDVAEFTKREKTIVIANGLGYSTNYLIDTVMVDRRCRSQPKK